ncbi:hypothetical protein [Methylibium petroleiphilum]|uniref:Uncharacterized protein n=1 Tax=Methylibium petroleiphilum (strain ATCC BAA-1232 / LMG 22953 / PM1) TaxID=420662 RepID=A2SMY5_METPP|nr:hypothetical protein [Methylibium petroleiphilum]ABM96924.1 hypothetical protein Mpe_B0146 [Methylibium petroleiphilum PM1]
MTVREEAKPTKRFGKSAALAALDARAARIAAEQKFDRSNGTSQLRPPGARDEITDEIINRAVEYGRMRAFEQFAEAIEEGFRFEPNQEST